MSGDGQTIGAAAPFDDTDGNNAGEARFFQFNGSDWFEIVRVGGEAASDLLGSFPHSISLSFDGARFAVGAHLNGGGGFFSGHVRVYDIVDHLNGTFTLIK